MAEKLLDCVDLTIEQENDLKNTFPNIEIIKLNELTQ